MVGGRAGGPALPDRRAHAGDTALRPRDASVASRAHTGCVPLSPRIRLAIVAAALALVASPDALAASSDKRPRPSDVPAASVETEIAPNGLQIFNNYATPERLLSSRSAVVHYVVLGIDAPL
jgi:hypothetical protein